jgi:hypothetical protein
VREEAMRRTMTENLDARAPKTNPPSPKALPQVDCDKESTRMCLLVPAARFHSCQAIDPE